jgi:hypothetical protein
LLWMYRTLRISIKSAENHGFISALGSRSEA